jgi:phosphoglycolate phosphatase
MPYRLAIFDFDGTLADSFPFFVSVYNQLAREFAFRVVEPDEMEALRGCGAREIMARVGMPAWKLPKVSRRFIGLMRESRDRIALFEGAEDALGHLADAGVRLAVVSSNSLDNVRAVLGPQITDRIGHFECGVSIFGKRSRLRKVLRASGVRASEAIAIGDQATDLEAAHAEGIAAGAVAWGYARPELLRSLAPRIEFATPRDLALLAPRAAALAA